MDELNRNQGALLKDLASNGREPSGVSLAFDFVMEHKLAIGAAILGTVALTVAGPRIARSLATRSAAAGEASLLEAGLASSERVSELAISKTAALALSENPVVLNSALSQAPGTLGRSLETLAARETPLPTRVMPAAYTWEQPAFGGAVAGDTRSLLNAIVSGQARPYYAQPTPYEIALELARSGARPPGLVPGQIASHVSGAGDALAMHEAGAFPAPAHMTGEPHGLADWIIQSTHDAGTGHAGQASGSLRELLGYAPAPRARPFIVETIADINSSAPNNPFVRHMPGIGRMEMPALSVRRKPPLDPHL